MPLDREAARQIVEPLRDVFADALELAAAARGAAGGVLKLVVNVTAWQVCWQWLPFRCVLIDRFLCRGLKLLDLAGQGLEVFVDGLFEQALLLGAEALGGRRELQPLEHRHLVGQLGIERFGVTHLRLKPTGQGANLGQAHAGEGRVDEVCADAGIAVHQGGNDAGDGWSRHPQMRQLRGYRMRITPASPMRCQGSPSTSASSCGWVNARMLPSLGQTNLPAFNRRAASHTPMPSCTSTFMRLARRLANR
jgi:hypothetical protein